MGWDRLGGRGVYDGGVAIYFYSFLKILLMYLVMRLLSIHQFTVGRGRV